MVWSNCRLLGCVTHNSVIYLQVVWSNCRLLGCVTHNSVSYPQVVWSNYRHSRLCYYVSHCTGTLWHLPCHLPSTTSGLQIPALIWRRANYIVLESQVKFCFSFDSDSQFEILSSYLTDPQIDQVNRPIKSIGLTNSQVELGKWCCLVAGEIGTRDW